MDCNSAIEAIGCGIGEAIREVVLRAILVAVLLTALAEALLTVVEARLGPDQRRLLRAVLWVFGIAAFLVVFSPRIFVW